MTRRQRARQQEQRYKAWTKRPERAVVVFGPAMYTFIREIDLCAIRGHRYKLARILAKGDGDRTLDPQHRLYGHYMALASKVISQIQRRVPA